MTQPANCRAGRCRQGGHDACKLQQTAPFRMTEGSAGGGTQQLQATADAACQYGRECC